jgi:hypothetical protein
VQQLIPDSRVFDAEKVGETLMDITPGLPETDNFQHWPPWRQLVVETARRVLDYTGGTLVIPMTVLVEQYWREISAGLAHHRQRFVDKWGRQVTVDGSAPAILPTTSLRHRGRVPTA